jgi:hypothetical protein
MTTSTDQGRAAAERVASADGTLVFALEDPPAARTPVAPLVGAALLGAGLGGAVGLLAGVRAWPALSAIGAALAFAFAWVHVQRALCARAAIAARRPRVLVERGELALVDGERRALVPLDRRVGLTLFASPSREDLVVAITHRDGVQFLAGRHPTGREHLDLLARAASTPENDLPIGPHVPTFTDGDRLLALVAALEARQPGALERVFLSDAGMADVVLDGRRLRAAQLDFDLAAPLTWRAYAFQEGTSFASHSFQATQLRQGDREVVLVALSPTGELASASLIRPPPGYAGPLAFEQVQRALARDLRLAHCLAEVPPPRNVRVAVDRLFVPRLRHALDLAPAEVIAKERAGSERIGNEVAIAPPEGIDQLRQSSPNVR